MIKKIFAFLFSFVIFCFLSNLKIQPSFAGPFECSTNSNCRSYQQCVAILLWTCQDTPNTCGSQNQAGFCALAEACSGGSNHGVNNHGCCFLNSINDDYDANGQAQCCSGVPNYISHGYVTNHTNCTFTQCAIYPNDSHCSQGISAGACAWPIGYDVACDGSPQYGACNGNGPYNTCGVAGGTQSITYTSTNYCNSTLTSGGGTKPNDFTAGDHCNANTTTGGCSNFYNNCDGGNGYSCRNGNSCQRQCTTGTTNCGGCGGGSQPTNTCNLNGTNPGSQTCQHNQWYGQNGCNYTNFTNGCQYSYNNCSGAYSCTNNNSCQTTVAGNIWKDYDHNGVNNGEPGIGGVTVHASNGATTTTDGNGNYTLSGFTQGTYNVWYDLPGGYRATTTSSRSVSLGSTLGTRTSGIDFGVTPLYTISGLIYDDVNINKYYESSVDTVHDGDSVTITGNGYNQTLSAGNFNTTQTLESGEYHIVYNGPPTGWKIVYPGPPAELYVRVGLSGSSDVNHVCSNENFHNATCDGAGNLSGANIGITNENAWVQGTCTDMRIDGTINNNGSTSTGFIDPIPQAPGSNTTCGGAASNGTNDSSYALGQGTVNVSGGGSLTCTNSGIVFSGNTVPDFGSGQASKDPYNWSLGGASLLTESFTPVNPTIIRTSYAYMSTTAQQSGIDLSLASHNIAPFCTGGINNCTLSSSLPDNVYLSQGNFYLNAYSFPANKNIVILINGDMYIKGNITVPVGSTVTFSVAGNIYVDPTVGTTPTDPTSNIAGIFSTDKSFIIQSNNTYGSACNNDGSPKDLRLNLQGSLVTNAGGNGGGFVNQRDLCVNDLACPTYQITQRPDFLLNAPAFIKHKNFVWQEQAP